MPMNTPQRGVIVPKTTPISGRYYGFGTAYPGGAVTTTGALSANTLYACPFFVHGATTADRISLNVTATGTGTAMRLGIYSATAAGLPDALLVDGGALDITGIGVKEATISQALAPGVRYFLALLADGTATVTGITTSIALFGYANATSSQGPNVLSRALAYAALPATWGTPGVPSGTMPHILVRAV